MYLVDFESVINMWKVFLKHPFLLLRNAFKWIVILHLYVNVKDNLYNIYRNADMHDACIC